ncbi:MAG TPA: hypothetical protein VM529_23475 [Gemmata sp.]|nr:hypothetical protein [Gemmata sp.]
MTSDEAEKVRRLVQLLEGQLPKWRAWFPDDNSDAYLPRRDLLLLVKAAKVGLSSSSGADHANNGEG